MPWHLQQPLQHCHPRQNKRYWLLFKTYTIQNMFWKLTRPSNMARKEKQSTRDHPAQSLGIGKFHLWASYSMLFFQKICKKPLLLNKQQIYSSIIWSLNNYTEDPMMESYSGVYLARKHKLHFRKPIMAWAVLINLDLNFGPTMKNGLLLAEEDNKRHNFCKEVSCMPNPQ